MRERAACWRDGRGHSHDQIVEQTMTPTSCRASSATTYCPSRIVGCRGGEPDPDGEQLEAIQEFLREDPKGKEIKYVWMDSACRKTSPRAPSKTLINGVQDSARGGVRCVRAQRHRGSMGLTRITATLAAGQHAVPRHDCPRPPRPLVHSRFWTQLPFEAWTSMQQALPEGLRSSVGTQGERFHIKCIQNAVEQADQHAQTLKNDWANKTPDDAHAILSKPDISVTNQKDKDGQLPKIKALNTTVQAAFVRIKQQRDKVEREARDAETALDDAAADLEACMQQVKTEQLEHERLAAALQQAKEELEACKTHGCATDLPRLKEEMAEQAVKEEDYDRKDVLKEKISAISGIEPAAAKVEKAEAELSEQRQKLDQAEDRKADLQIAHRASSRRLTEAQDEAAKVHKEAEQQQKTSGLATKPVPQRASPLPTPARTINRTGSLPSAAFWTAIGRRAAYGRPTCTSLTY